MYANIHITKNNSRLLIPAMIKLLYLLKFKNTIHMANLRVLKKDIDYLAMEVISDCWAFMFLNPDKKHEECNSIIDDTISFRNELFMKANHPVRDEKTGKSGAYYRNLRKELFEGIDRLFVRISDLNK